MSYRERYPAGGVMDKFEEHRFVVKREIALFIFHTNLSKFFQEFRLGFTNKYVELCNCGLSSDAIFLKCDQ